MIQPRWIQPSSHLKGDLGPAQGLQWDDLLVSGIWPGKAFYSDWPGEALPSSQQLAHRPNSAFCLLEPWPAKFLGRGASCLARYRPLFLVTSGDRSPCRFAHLLSKCAGRLELVPSTSVC
jgi:hypothetical protein